jgi:hypothetical protein
MSHPKELLDLTRKIALEMSVDPNLAIAITEQESGYVASRVRYEKNWKYLINPAKYAISLGITVETEIQLQMFSYGLMQVMGSVARECGFASHLSELIWPELGIYYGCKKLKQLSKKYPNLNDLISSYNAGSPVIIEGEYKNKSYVSEVKQRLKLLGGLKSWKY